jgi:hypothetical protein
VEVLNGVRSGRESRSEQAYAWGLRSRGHDPAANVSIKVFGERHLRHLLRSYIHYYNGARTHLSLSKDAPIPRAVQVVGRIPILGIAPSIRSDLISDRNRDGFGQCLGAVEAQARENPSLLAAMINHAA